LLGDELTGSARPKEFMMQATRIMLAAGGILCAAALACSGTSNPSTPSAGSTTTGSSGGGTSSATGSLSIRLTDSPFSDAKALLVTFSDVSVHQADPGDWKSIPFASGASRTCDLKKLQSATDVLGIGSLAAGKYTQIRLDVSSAAIYFDNPSVGGPCAPQINAPAGTSAPVDIPSGQIKLNHEFTLTSAGSTITLDFDGDQSVRQTGSPNSNGNGNGNGHGGSTSKYMMVPVIRVVSVQ
jgi:hypothetical protein